MTIILHFCLYRKLQDINSAPIENGTKTTMATALDEHKREVAVSNRRYEKYNLRSNSNLSTQQDLSKSRNETQSVNSSHFGIEF